MQSCSDFLWDVVLLLHQAAGAVWAVLWSLSSGAVLLICRSHVRSASHLHDTKLSPFWRCLGVHQCMTQPSQHCCKLSHAGSTASSMCPWRSRPTKHAKGCGRGTSRCRLTGASSSGPGAQQWPQQWHSSLSSCRPASLGPAEGAPSRPTRGVPSRATSANQGRKVSKLPPQCQCWHCLVCLLMAMQGTSLPHCRLYCSMVSGLPSVLDCSSQS